MLAITVMCRNMARNITKGTFTRGIMSLGRPLEDLDELEAVQVDDGVDLHVRLDGAGRGLVLW